VQFDLTADNTIYGTYSRGYKGPAYNIFFNLTASGTNVINAETADAFEVGLKNTLFGGLVTLNLAGFYAKYYNYQANNPDTVAGVLVTRLTNAGTISTRGFEVDFLARPSRNLSVSGGLSYAEARVDQFRVPTNGVVTAVIAPGTPLANAPRWKLSLAVDQRLPLTETLDMSIGGNFSYQTEQLSQFDANPAIRQTATIGDYALTDVQAGIGDRDGRWRLTGYIRNVFNQSFAASITSGGPGGSFRYIIPREAERFFGATLRVNLGN
jgi:iron complex outermembrane receptor protein